MTLGHSLGDDLIVPRMLVVAHENERNIRTGLVHFRQPSLRDALQTAGVVNGVTHDDDVGAEVEQSAKEVARFEPRRAPRGELHLWKGKVNKERSARFNVAVCLLCCVCILWVFCCWVFFVFCCWVFFVFCFAFLFIVFFMLLCFCWFLFIYLLLLLLL